MYSTDGRKPDIRKRYTQDVIKHSYLTLMKDRSADKITVKEICRAANINRSTFYAHFHDLSDLEESLENELIGAFMQALQSAEIFDTTAIIEALYDVIKRHMEYFRRFVFGNAGSPIIAKMIELAKRDAIGYWNRILPWASKTELEMMYMHLANGLMHVIVDGYDKFSKEETILFSTRIVQTSLSLLRI